MQPLVFDHFSSNVYNGFLKDCTITFDKSDGSDPTGREEYWKRVLKTVNPHGLNTIDWLCHLGTYLNFCKILCIFRKGIYIVKYILLTYFQQYLLFVSLGFVFRGFITIIILLLLLLLFLVLLLISLLLSLMFRIALLKVVSTFFFGAVILHDFDPPALLR